MYQFFTVNGYDNVDFRIATAHVESCATCQSRLAELAADNDEWSEAKSALTIDDSELHIEYEQEERSWSATGQRRPPNSWTASMTNQLLSPPSHPEMLGRLGRYEVERMIGAGGMGVVFKGFDSELNRPVAIKVLAPHLAGSGAARKRFSREARAAAAIVHEHVVSIHNVESDSEPPFLVMQYVAGESLQGRLDREGPLSVCEVLRIARQTAAGLSAAHEQGLVHRDVKPSNVLLEEGIDRALLTDFGLARASDDASLTHSGHVPGTPHYMSPEQARGESADQGSDLFSLGSLMYAMCTGRSPFRAETSYGVLRRITDLQPRSVQEVNADVPIWLCSVIEKLHAKSPGERFKSASEVADMLGQCLAHAQQPESQPLPESVAALARTAAQGSRFRAALVQRPFTTFGCVAASVALLVAAMMITQGGWSDGRRAVRSSAGSGDRRTAPSSISRAAITTSPDTGTDYDPATNWDSAETQVQQLNQQVGAFTTRADRLWDELPVSAQMRIDYEPLSPDELSRKESVE